MKILIVAATEFEIKSLLDYYQENNSIIKNEVHFCITGIGSFATTFFLTKCLQDSNYDLVINAGIAGAINNTDLNLGDVVQVVCDYFGDIGAEEEDGTFIDFFKNGLINSETSPFVNGELFNLNGSEFDFLPLAKGVTRNTTSGFLPNIEKRNKIQSADVETMESAAFFYVCLLEKVNFIAIRAISNYVESRNKKIGVWTLLSKI